MQAGANIKVHGHRGSRGTHPENTLPAFEEALLAGADVLELDLHLTADDVVVVSHDPDITSRLCRDTAGNPIEKPVPIRSLMAKDLLRYECGMVPQDRFPLQKQIRHLSIPTFEQFLQWWGKKASHLEMNIETKMTAQHPRWVPDARLFVSQIVALLRAHRAVEKAILQSFDFSTLREAKKIEPGLRLSCLFDENRSFCAATHEVGAQFASPDLKLVSPEEVARCHAQKIQVVPWTANEESEWSMLLHAKVDAIITDYPRRLVQYLKNPKRS